MKLQFDSSFIQTTFSILLLVVLCTTAYSNAFLGNETDYKALLAIKSKLNDDDGGVLMSWNDSLHHCSWEGVTCGPKHNRVIKLYLSARDLGGTISPFIGNMTFLTYIGLSNNSLSGPIPPEIGRLWRLQGLYLFNNILSGEIPGSISGCVKLQNLSLSYNHLHGELPTGLGRLSNLKYLWIESNYRLTGSIFKVIANLTSLEEIHAFGNFFKGTISPFIGNLTFLTKIVLSDNGLSGPIPPEIGRLWRLQGLYLSYNSISGEIPSNISGCINLQNLSLGINHLQGEVPMGLGRLSNLKRLWINSNYKVVGPLFKVIANLTSLEAIHAYDNAFTGNIPDSIICRMTNLTWLEVYSNKLSGTIPPSIFNLSSLQELYLGDNQLRGSIPPFISSFTLPQLQFLSLYQNNLSGPLPTSIQNLTTLQYIELFTNDFTGHLSINFGHLNSLQWLSLYSNKFEGDINFIITTLLNCTYLEHLYLDGNYFTGVLPKLMTNLSTNLFDLSIGGGSISGQIPIGISNLINLTYLEITKSQLTGGIPLDFGKLQKLERLYLYSNKLTGEIPFSFGNLSRLSELELNDNNLQGRIPPSLGSCKSLLYLYLNDNNFSGPLPKELFGGSAKFIQLSLSFNQLQGSLPIEITGQLLLTLFDIYGNKLSGEFPQGLGNLLDLQYLLMGVNFFHGPIPPSLASLKSLAYFDISQNNMSGHLPQYFSTFPYLLYLNLSYNNFEGEVPSKGVYANSSAIFLDGNKRLCGGILQLHLSRCVEKRRMSRALMLAISITSAIFGVLTIATCIWLYLQSRKRRRKSLVSSHSLVKKAFLKVSYDMLLKATNGFSLENLLGSGAFGSVYKGVLDGITIAVKVLNLHYRGGSKSLMRECEVLRTICHRNLVGIITVCSSIDFQGNDFKALVFEFMPNGNLDSWLHQGRNLSLLQRVDIAIDVAHALNYIHHECENPIAHCDLKPSNVLLDHDMVAHVADFGLAKVLAQPLHPNQSTSIGARGTIGYVAPEYGMGSEVSLEADLYSFGILLLELMTRKRPTDEMFNEDLNLHMYAKAALPDQVLQIVDSSVLIDEDENEEVDSRVPRLEERLQQREKCISFIIRIGVACSRELPSDRMKMSEAISELQKAKNIIDYPRHRHNLPRGA